MQNTGAVGRRLTRLQRKDLEAKQHVPGSELPHAGPKSGMSEPEVKALEISGSYKQCGPPDQRSLNQEKGPKKQVIMASARRAVGIGL